MEHFHALVGLQYDHIKSLTSTLTTYKKLSKTKRTATVIKSRIEKGKSLWGSIQEEHRKIRLMATQKQLDEDEYFTTNQYQLAEELYDEILDFFCNALDNDVKPSAHSSSDSDEEKPRVNCNSSFRLPPVTITKFNGKLTEWERFKSRFETLVIENRKLNDMQRLYHLFSSLEGEASSKIDHLEITGDNFQIAWRILVNKYEDKCRIAYAHLDALLSLSEIDSKNPNSIGNLRDKINTLLAQLKKLELPVEQWDLLIAYLILRKFDRATDDEWEDKRPNGRELPTYTEVDEFLLTRSHKLESIAVKRSLSSNQSSSDKQSKPQRAASFSVDTFKPKCFVCDNEHPIYQCAQFRTMSTDERRQAILKQRRCFNCLSTKHNVQNCQNPNTCKTCHKRHHTLLHPQTNPISNNLVASSSNEYNQSNSTQANVSVANETSVASFCSNRDAPLSVLRPTARLTIYSSDGRSICVRAFLDHGSESNFITENVVQLLKLRIQRRDTIITGMTEKRMISHSATTFEFSSIFNNSPTHSTNAVIVSSLRQIKPPRVKRHFEWSHLKFLQLADPTPLSTEPFDLLIGTGLLSQLMKSGIVKGLEHEPIAQCTELGWILSGFLTAPTNSSNVQVNSVTLEHIQTQLKQFWELEELPHAKRISPADKRCEEFFEATYQRTDQGRFVVRLPFNAEFTGNLGDSRTIALKRLSQLQFRLTKQPKLKSDYSQFLNEYESSNHMSRIAHPEQSNIPTPYFIPHHPVIREESVTTKLRVVFNASQPTSLGKSLNEFLMAGPKLQTDLPIIIMKWRMHQYVMISDIKQMFRQILIHEDDTDYQRILWRQSPSNETIEYKLKTVTYGTTSAPYLAIKTLHQLVKLEGDQYPLASQAILQSMYVDDIIFGSDDPTTAIQTRDQLIQLLRRGGFELHKWASNEPRLLLGLDIPSNPSENKTFKVNDQMKILGVNWNPAGDFFYFKTISAPVTTTKRSILSVIARFFDPLGWITPILIVAKIFLQKLWLLKCDWDEELSCSLKPEWITFYNSLTALEEIKLPRWSQFHSKMTNVELHGFCDASAKAYAAAVYLRIKSPSNQIETSLITAKSKVSPLKRISSPRLELCAAYMLSHLMKSVKSALGLPTVSCYCWTDSSITLEWIKHSPSRWKTFVANRVTAIQEVGPDFVWNHVSTVDNPADCASRGVSSEALPNHPLWWSGPEWLKHSKSTWSTVSSHDFSQDELEEDPSYNVGATQCEPPWSLQYRYSSWSKLLRITAYCQRFVRRLKSRKPLPKGTNCVTPDEIHRAKVYWLLFMQEEAFKEEFVQLKANQPVDKSSRLASLVPFLDSDNLIRVSGRLRNSPLPDQTKFPIILSSHHLLKVMISEIHLKHLHGGNQLIVSYLRQEFWIFRLRAVIRSVLHRCIPCIRHQAKMSNQLMGSLPEGRVTHGRRAFCQVGLDYAGPIHVRQDSGRGHRTHKAYISVFVCMATKAVHLELVTNYSTSAFIAAFQRFIARRGMPSDVHCDNGTTFQGAERELHAQHQAACTDPSLITRMASDGINWHFIPPAAPHFGGLWEAAVKSVKYHIKRCVGTLTLTYEEMNTLLCRIESCLNSRPLGPLSDCLEDYQCLTPGHFLIGSALTSPPAPSLLNIQENRLSRWQRLQRTVEEFWRYWQKDYIQTLQQRQKWRVIQTNIQPGKLVLINKPGLPPSHWELGRVVECHPGPDKIIRVVTLKTSSSTLKRPITKLCLLPIDINKAEEADAGMAGGAST